MSRAADRLRRRCPGTLPHRHPQGLWRKDPRLDRAHQSEHFRRQRLEWNIPASAWYAQHVFEHWPSPRTRITWPRLPTNDQGGLPVLEDRLKRLPDGTLVAPNGWSPEHGPREDGVMHDQQLSGPVRELSRHRQGARRGRRYQAKIANCSRIWLPIRSANGASSRNGKPTGRTPTTPTAYLASLRVYPGRQISLTRTPDLARAAIVSSRPAATIVATNL